MAGNDLNCTLNLNLSKSTDFCAINVDGMMRNRKGYSFFTGIDLLFNVKEK